MLQQLSYYWCWPSSWVSVSDHWSRVRNLARAVLAAAADAAAVVGTARQQTRTITD